jgi:hypothetical protein
VAFWIEARVFEARHGIYEDARAYQSLRNLFQVTQTGFISAIIFAVFLLFIDPFLLPHLQSAGLAILDNEDYVTLLATISGICGVFIGLYYAGITTVGGAIYAKVPNNIRDLLAQERIGSLYMSFLAFLVFFGIVLIALRVIGYPRIHLAVPVVTVCAGIGVFSFVKLGQRAFYFFDPTALSNHIFEQLQHWLEMVTAGGFRWGESPFQSHAHRQASSALDTLDTLVEITAKEPHLNGNPFVGLTKNLLRFSIEYERAKRRIPVSSHWYKRRYEHRDWYKTEDSRVNIAHRTGTTIAPNISGDMEWIEDRVIPIIKRCLEANFTHSRFSEITRLLNYIDIYLQSIAREGRIHRAMEILAELGESIFAHLAPQSQTGLAQTELLDKLGLTEKISLLPISILVAYRENLNTFETQKTFKLLSELNWKNNVSIYQGQFPSYCLPQLEWLHKRIAFESTIEGIQITPTWYVTELILQSEAEQLAQSIEAFINKAASNYENWVKRTIATKHPWLVAATMSREWEYWHKCEAVMNIYINKWESLNKARRMDGLQWPSVDIASYQRRTHSRKQDLLKMMSQQNILLALLTRPQDFPDYSGQFLHISGEVAFDALLNNDLDLLRSVFPPYFKGCLMRFDHLRPQSSDMDWRAQQELKVAAAPLLDLMEISGYSRLMSDVHGNQEVWSVVADVWNDYLKDLAQSPLPAFAAVTTLSEGTFEIPHRGVLRTNWHLQVNNKLSDIPRRMLSSSAWGEPEADHKSALVRIFAEDSHGSFYSGVDVFKALYLREKDGTDKLDIGWKAQNLVKELERNEIRYQEHAKGGDGATE